MRWICLSLLLLVTAAAAGLAADPKADPEPAKEETKMTQQAPSPAPLMVQLGELLLAGTRYEGENKEGEIPKMWDEAFIPRAQELEPLRSGEGLYGVARALPGVTPGPFEYLAAMPVKSLDKLPQGMVGWRIPARTYAVLPARDVPDIGAVAASFSEALAESEYVEDGGYMLEYYPPSYPETSIIYVYTPVKPRKAAKTEPMTIYHPEPKIVQKGELKIVGLEDLIIDGKCARTGKPVASLFEAVAVRGQEIRNMVDANILIGDNRCDDPARVWDGPTSRQLAGNEVTAFEAVPADMSMRLLAPSKYAVFSCEAPVDPETRQPLIWADFGRVYPWYAFNRARWGFKEKLYYLEVYYHADVPQMGYPIARYELWVPIE